MPIPNPLDLFARLMDGVIGTGARASKLVLGSGPARAIEKAIGVLPADTGLEPAAIKAATVGAAQAAPPVVRPRQSTPPLPPVFRNPNPPAPKLGALPTAMQIAHATGQPPQAAPIPTGTGLRLVPVPMMRPAVLGVADGGAAATGGIDGGPGGGPAPGGDGDAGVVLIVPDPGGAPVDLSLDGMARSPGAIAYAPQVIGADTTGSVPLIQSHAAPLIPSFGDGGNPAMEIA